LLAAKSKAMKKVLILLYKPFKAILGFYDYDNNKISFLNIILAIGLAIGFIITIIVFFSMMIMGLIICGALPPDYFRWLLGLVGIL